MAETPTDVLVAGYPGIDGAASRWALFKDTRALIDGVILVTHGHDHSDS